jgi:hypothetical protein
VILSVLVFPPAKVNFLRRAGWWQEIHKCHNAYAEASAKAQNHKVTKLHQKGYRTIGLKKCDFYF